MATWNEMVQAGVEHAYHELVYARHMAGRYAASPCPQHEEAKELANRLEDWDRETGGQYVTPRMRSVVRDTLSAGNY